MSVKPIDRPKSIHLLLFQAFFRRAKKNRLSDSDFSQLPEKEHRLFVAKLQSAHIEKFHKIVNWSAANSEHIHPCYFHLLAFPQHLRLMLDDDFPFPLLGTIHLQNRIQQFAPIDIDSSLEVSSRFGDIKPHAKGIVFSIKTSIETANAEIWRSESWFLVKQLSEDMQNSIRSDEPTNPSDPNAEYKGSSSWHFSAKTGRQYARVSGDYNPIHLYRFSAKLFGFKRAIAHGMWSKSWCVSAMSEFVQPQMIVDVKFNKPLYLPNRVTFHQDNHANQQVFALSTRDGKYIHLEGQLDY